MERWEKSFTSISANSKRIGRKMYFTRWDFAKWHTETPKKCHYCDCPESILHLIKSNRNRNYLTIDRKDNFYSYSEDNICFACQTCNMLKSDVFSPDEWKEIAQKYIKPKWIKILTDLSQDKIKEKKLVRGKFEVNSTSIR